MDDINQIPFSFDPRIGMIVGVMVGFLVFAVSLDLTWEKLMRVLKRPKAPTIGLVAQFGILPAIAFLAGLYLTEAPSIALGLLLVTCCPGGALSNYLTGIAKGDVATSISMTTISTLFSIILTPVLFAFWASMNSSTLAVLQNISMDPQRVIMTLLIMLVIPVTAGMLLRAKRPDTANHIRKAVRLLAGIVFAVIVAMIIGSNIKSLSLLAQTALFPVIITFTIAVGLGWSLGKLTGLISADRRAVAIEVAFQNVALAIGLGITFFPSLAGITAVAILWGIVHLTLGTGLALLWSRIKIKEQRNSIIKESRPHNRKTLSVMKSLKILSFFLFFGLLSVPLLGQERPPVIDMHMHTGMPHHVTEGTPALCRPEPCQGEGGATAQTELLQKTLDIMDRYNIVKGFLSGVDLQAVDQWKKVAPDRFIASPFIINPGTPDSLQLKKDIAAGRFGGIGEIGTQLNGIAPNDPTLEPYFALAEELDVPLLIHTLGIGPYMSHFSSAAGNPLLLEEVLVKHPNLRIFVENAGYPYRDEMIAMMYQYPQLYADVSTITWVIPRTAFYDYLKALIRAGLGKRLMFGSDQMVWPEKIVAAVEAIEQAPFLTEEQKEDIFYNNASRFLRLDDAEDKPIKTNEAHNNR